MKLIHVADLHLGMEPEKHSGFGISRGRELWETFARLIDECNQVGADLLLLAGDFFHRQPLVRELQEADFQFSRLQKTRVVLIAGNHDYIGTRSHYEDFVWNDKVTMLREDELQTIEYPDLGVSVTGFSYHKRDITEAKIDGAMPSGDGINILLAHGGDAKDVPMDYRRLALAGFDYVALGHIHKPEQRSGNIWQAGSLEPLDKNETGEHGYLLVEITAGAKHVTKAEFVPFSLRKYVNLEVTVTPEDTNGSLTGRIRQMLTEGGKNNLYRITLSGTRDEHLEPDLAAIAGLGLVTEVSDETLPEYDFDAIRAANHDNLIGMFIDRILESEKQDEVTKKALYYGLLALMKKE